MRGFILTREWRDGQDGCRLTLWAATDQGPARITLTRIEPVMFVRRSDAPAAAEAMPDSASIRNVDLETLDGEPVQAVYFPTQRALDQARDKLRNQEIECLEADIAPAERFLMERFIRGSFTAHGPVRLENGFARLVDPKLQDTAYQPDLRVMSLDIETSPDSSEVYSVAWVCGDCRRVIVRGRPQGSAAAHDFELLFQPDEAALLRAFIAEVRQLDPDVLIGWNVINFDLAVLERRCKALNVEFTLGRDGAAARVLPGRGASLNAVARVPGRVVLDGIECLRAAFWVFDSYALESVSRALLGRGKAISGEGDKTTEITRLFETDKPALARYNIEDCRLVLDIFAATDLLAFVVERTRLTGLAMGRLGGSVAAFDYLYLPRLHRKGRVAPSLTSRSYPDSSPGGYVLDSVPGIHENVAVMDFKSLYPSIIRTFKIDPLGRAQPGDDPVPGFLGAAFSRHHNLLPAIIEELWRKRDEAKGAGNQPLSQAIKILMNSFYGVLGTDGCRFYHPQLASSITRRGHEIIQTSKRWIEERGFEVIYGDTDSLFVLLRGDPPSLEREALDLVAALNRRWTDFIRLEYRLDSYLEIELETLFRKFFMPRIRGRDTGSKKRYAGLAGDTNEMVIKGLEAVRSDWTEAARSFQRELLRAVFLEEDAESLVRRQVSRIHAGEADAELVYRKRLRRPLDAYRKNVPPHVKAARQLDKPGSDVRYCVTVAGPQPLEKLTAPLDYNHYIDRQIKPVADAILPWVGLDFDRITGGQGDLFQ